MNLQQLVDADLTPLKLILDTVPPLLRKHAADALAIGDQPGADAYLQALGLELESLVLQLNATVDGFVFLLVTRLKGKKITASYTKKGRDRWLTDLEKAMGFQRSELKEWNEVEATRTDSNSVKHRLGLEFAPGQEAPLSLTNVVQLTEGTVLARFLGLRLWLLDLVERCESLDTAGGAA